MSSSEHERRLAAPSPELLDFEMPEEPESWSAYDVSFESFRTGALGEIGCYVERGRPRRLSIADLPSELFNHDLARVDVSNHVAVAAFCSKYGIFPSPLYLGAQRLKHFRARSRSSIKYYKMPNWNYLDVKGQPITYLIRPSFGFSSFPHLERRDPITGELMDGSVLEGSTYLFGNCVEESVPAALSEIARAHYINDDSVVGVVSELEVAQTIRTIQMATQVAMAGYYAMKHRWFPTDLLAYLHNSRYVSQMGLAYFQYSSNELFCGYEVDSWENMLKKPEFKQMVAKNDDPNNPHGGLNAKIIFNSVLADEFYGLVEGASRYLLTSARSYDEAYHPEAIAAACEEKGTFARARRLIEGLRTTRVFDEAMAEGSCPQAVIYQFLQGFKDPAPYRQCEYCGRIFKKYLEEGYHKNIRETRFCRRSCNVGQNKKDRAHRDAQPV